MKRSPSWKTAAAAAALAMVCCDLAFAAAATPAVRVAPAAAAAPAAPAAPAGDAVPTGKLPEGVTPLHYVWELNVDPSAERFSGRVRIRVRLDQAADHVWLHARDLKVSRASVTDTGGKTTVAAFAIRDPGGVAEVRFAAAVPAQVVELDLTYDAPFNSQQFQGLYKAHVGDDVYAVTQMEAVSARFALPSFDEPRFKTPFEVTLTVPKNAAAFANALPVEEMPAADGRSKTVKFAKTPPLPTYLLAVAVGPWDVATAVPMPPNGVRAAAIQLRGIGPRGTAPQFQWILEQTPAIVRFYEEYTGQPYPFDKLDLLGTRGFTGAMENAGLIIFQDILLRIDASSSSRIYRGSFNVTAHEVAHQWFGDLVTVPWWDDIWLNEAFATWAQQKETQALKPEYLGGPSRVEATLGAMADDSLLSARSIRQPINAQGDIENAFDSITYEKGAAVLRMFEEWLGEDVYRDAMRRYLAEHAFGSGSSQDLIATLARVSGKSALPAAMTSFLNQPGVPLAQTQLRCTRGKASLIVSQSRYLPYGTFDRAQLHWVLPLCVHTSSRGHEAKQCFLLEEQRQEFSLEGGCPDWYVPNADAAGYYRFDMAPREFTALRARLPQLPPVEQIVIGDAVESAFKRGAASPAAVLDTMPPLAASSVPQAASALFDVFDWIHRYLADDASRPALEGYAQGLYEPALEALGYERRPSEQDAAARLRTRFADFLAFTARDAAVRQKLNAAGRAALGLDGGAVDLTRADPDLRGDELKAAVQESGAPAFDAVIGELKRNRQAEQRRDLIVALGATHDPGLSGRALDFGLTPEVPLEELAPLFFAFAREPGNSAFLLSWLAAHFDAVRAKLPEQTQGILPVLAATGRCSEAEADELKSFFTPRLQGLVGGERQLAQSLEAVQQCAALRRQVGTAALTDWVRVRAHPPRARKS